VVATARMASWHAVGGVLEWLPSSQMVYSVALLPPPLLLSLARRLASRARTALAGPALPPSMASGGLLPWCSTGWPGYGSGLPWSVSSLGVKTSSGFLPWADDGGTPTSSPSWRHRQMLS
jgi:hypothetical protein